VSQPGGWHTGPELGGQEDRVPATLSSAEVEKALGSLPGWTGDPAGLHRRAELPSFRAVVDAVVAIADVAEAADHHPDLDVRWRTLQVRLVTHSAGGVTHLDVEMARRIEDLLSSRLGS
jgi:4a-hydroxytetrahydrobiopterin dehydratase